MDYKAIYYKIIENAKKETENGKRSLGYYEKHHIQPKSLGGTNDKENLVKLTAREHFVCHWLLVKMYDKGTVERNKMLCALWRMNHNGSNTHEIHYINSRAYEALRIEFAKTIGERSSIYQQGKNNSQFGTKWYTNRNTGESKKFKEKPVEDFWIEGRNLFHGESYKIIKQLHNHKKRNSTFTIERYNKSLQKSRELWDKYHSGNYYKLEDFANELQVLKNAIYLRFKKYIPIFKSNKKRRHFSSDKSLIGKYE